MSTWLKPCPGCGSPSISVSTNCSYGTAKFICLDCGYEACYSHRFSNDNPFANAAQDFWNGLEREE